MKQFIKYISTILILSILLISSTFIYIIKTDADVFQNSYQSVIADKYRILQQTNEPKIILVGGSSLAFGINQDMLENATGYKVVNLGLHAGFGTLFYSELSKENINPGDIVLLGYEYDWINGFDFLGQDLIMSGIGDNINMYKHIPANHWKDFIGYLPKFAELKASHDPSNDAGMYSKKSFDLQTGQMIKQRIETIDYVNNTAVQAEVNLANATISDSSIEYLTDYKKYIESKGASVYFITPPLLDQAITCNYDDFDKLIKQEEAKIGIPYISNPIDYIFPQEYIYDSIYHCNSQGEIIRTELLINDIKQHHLYEI